MKERELRIKVPENDFKKLIQKYDISTKSVVQTDSYYDFEDYRLMNSKHDLRIREENKIFKKAELKCLFYLDKKQKWHFDIQYISFDNDEIFFKKLFQRIAIPYVDEELSGISNVDSFCKILQKNGVLKVNEIIKKRYKQEFEDGIILFDDVIDCGFFIKVKTNGEDPSAYLKEVYPNYSENDELKFGYTEYFMNKSPEIFYSTQSRKKLFFDNCRWNVLENEVSQYETINQSKNIWVNIHFKNYDLYVAYYIDNLFDNIGNIDKCYFLYWDNLIYPDIDPNTHLNDYNIQKLKSKLELIFPKKFVIHKFSDLKKIIIEKMDLKIRNEIENTIENIRYYLDSEFIKRIINISKPSLNIQVINNMIEDFVLCCFSEQLLGQKMDVYYTGTRFIPLESLFRKFLYKYREMHFPDLFYVDFPPYFDDFAKNIESESSQKLIERTVSSFLHIYPEKKDDIFGFYSVDNKADLTKTIIYKLNAINEKE